MGAGREQLCSQHAALPHQTAVLARGTHWHQVNTYSHAWTHVRTHRAHAPVDTRAQKNTLRLHGTAEHSDMTEFLNRIQPLTRLGASCCTEHWHILQAVTLFKARNKQVIYWQGVGSPTTFNYTSQGVCTNLYPFL